MIIYRGPSRIDGGEIVAIITGVGSTPSENPKTGKMAQLWILCADTHPTKARQTGADSAICGGCVHRHKAQGGQGTCYVAVFAAPSAIWMKFQRGGYATVTPSQANADILTADIPLRLGAYGDPAALPPGVLRDLTAGGIDWTGYTHQWRRFPSLKAYVMASADSVADAEAAQNAGWRTFRVRHDESDTLQNGEISCPASAESGNLTQCAKCRLCNGTDRYDRRKNIAILQH